MSQTRTDRAAAPPTPPPPPRRTLRPLLLRLHFYAGVLVAPFLLVAALSGMAYALAPQIERAVHHEELTTDSRGPALPLDDQVAAARELEPDLPLLAVRPAAEPGQTTRVLLDDGRTDTFRRLAVFVDPVTGQVRGEPLTSYGGSGALPAQTWLDELHRNLHLGEPGRLYSELAASWLWVIAVAGLALWLTRRTRDGRTARQRWRDRLVPSRRGSPRARRLSRHGVAGTWLLLGFLVLSVTGLTWSTHAGARVTELRTALDWSTPAVTSDLAADGGSETGHEGHEGHEGGAVEGTEDGATVDSPGVGYQAAYDAARGEDLTGPVEVTGPVGATGTYVVSELDESWPTQADAASIDPASGEVVDVVRFADYPFMAKAAAWGIALHMGVLFGVWNQAALVLLAGALVAMVVTGYRMWWQRRPTRGSRLAMGRPAKRGAWRSAPPLGLAAFLLGAAVVGWALPVLGVSLLVFLVVDAVIGAVGAHRARADARPPAGQEELTTAR